MRFDKRTVLDVYLVDLGGPKHVRRLRDFAREHAHMLPLLPAERREAVRTFQRPHWVGEALYRSERPSDRRYLALLREVERRMALEVTTGRSTVFEVALQRLAVTEMAPSASTLGRGRPRVVIATYQPAEPAAGQTA